MNFSRRSLLQYFLASGAAFSATVAMPQSTEFEELLNQLRNDSSLNLNETGHEELFFLDRLGLETTPLRGRKSEREVSGAALDLIISSEITSENRYKARYQSPIWPEGRSGVTIGIGYDLGYTTADGFQADWQEHIDEADIQKLTSAVGLRANAAKDVVNKFKDIQIPFPIALNQFQTEMIPRYAFRVEDNLPNTHLLPGDSFGALVSLVYNRGASFRLKGDRYAEMRNILTAMRTKNFEPIPDEIRGMKRIWSKELRGLWIRRDAEAALFERGLANQ